MEQTDFEKLALELAGRNKPEPTAAVVEAPELESKEKPIVSEPEISEDSLDDVNEPESTEEATPESDEDTVDSEETLLNEEDVELDDFDTSVVEQDAEDVDFKTLSKDLGLEVSTKAELVSTIDNFKKEISELKGVVDGYKSNIPEDLQKAIDLAKTGGDYMSYLGVSSVDYSSIDPVELFEYEVAKLFTDNKGVVNEDELDEYLGGVSDVEKKLRGKELQSGYITKQINEKRALEVAAAEKKAKSDEKLRNVINSVDNIAGFKIKPAQKEQLFSDISTGKMVNELFYNKSGEYDFNKIVDNYFKVKNFDKIQNFYKQRVTTATKKEILNDITNTNLSTPPRQASPEAPKAKSALDNYLAQLQGKSN